MTAQRALALVPRGRYTVVIRDCIACGRSFPGAPHTRLCSAACSQRAWRAVAMLRGTHGYVDGQFKRLPSA